MACAVKKYALGLDMRVQAWPSEGELGTGGLEAGGCGTVLCKAVLKGCLYREMLCQVGTGDHRADSELVKLPLLLSWGFTEGLAMEVSGLAVLCVGCH